MGLPPGTDKTIAVYNITGVMEFAKENAYRNLGDPKVHLSFVLDTSGMVSLIKAEATYDLPPPPPEELGEAESTNSDEGASTTDTSTGNATTEEADDASGETKVDETKKESAKKEQAKKKSSKKSNKPAADLVIRKVLKVVENVDQVKPHTWTPAMIAESRAKLAALTLKDNERKANEGNKLTLFY